MRTLLVTALITLAACSERPAFTRIDGTTTADRIWMTTRGGTQVWRCVDATPPDRPFLGHATVFCKEATLYEGSTRPGPDRE